MSWIQRSPVRDLLLRIDKAEDSVVLTQAEFDSIVAEHPQLIDQATEPTFRSRNIAGFMWAKTLYIAGE